MLLPDFYSQTLNRTYGTPPPILQPNQGTYRGQCVSYARQYMEAVDGVKSASIGNAKDYWDNPYMLQFYDQFKSPQEGDLVVFDSSYGGGYGHIGVVYQGRLLSQNFTKPLVVTLDPLPARGILGYLRRKGGEMPVTSKQAKDLAEAMGQPERELEIKGKVDLNDVLNAIIIPRFELDKKKVVCTSEERALLDSLKQFVKG